MPEITITCGDITITVSGPSAGFTVSMSGGQESEPVTDALPTVPSQSKQIDFRSFFGRILALRPSEFQSNDAQFARFLGINPQRFFDWKVKAQANCQFTPKRELVESCARALGISPAELQYGKGEE